MAHFTRTRANLAAWATGTVIQNIELDELDEKTFKALNGDDGGTWAPSAVITIGGSGLTMTGPFTAADATISDLHGNWVCDGNVTFSNQIHLTGTQYLANGSSLYGIAGCTLAGTFGGTPTLSGNVLFSGNPNFSGSVGFVGAAETTLFAGYVTLQNNVALQAPIVCTAGGRLRRRLTIGADANGSYNVGTSDIVLVRSGALSADRTYTVATTAAANGDMITFCTQNTDHSIYLTNCTPNMTLKWLSGHYHSATFVYDSSLTAWMLVDSGLVA